MIPVLLHKEGWLVQSRSFSEYKKLGNAKKAVQRLSQWDADELIYLDISKNRSYPPDRNDTAAPRYDDLEDLILEVSKVARMPITFGGGITTLNDIETRLRLGADKVSINREAKLNPKLIAQASKEFGRQCIVVSVDYEEFGSERRIHGEPIQDFDSSRLADWLLELEHLGAGEILLNSVSRDGMKSGYDIDFLAHISALLGTPIIACGGAGSWDHMAKVLSETNIDAVAAANIFHFQDQSVYLARMHLHNLGLQVRPPSLQKKTHVH